MPIGIIHSSAVLPFLWIGNTEASGAPVLLISPVWISSLLSRVSFKKQILEKKSENTTTTTTTTTHWILLCSSSGMISVITSLVHCYVRLLPVQIQASKESYLAIVAVFSQGQLWRIKWDLSLQGSLIIHASHDDNFDFLCTRHLCTVLCHLLPIHSLKIYL